jgi:hypothetical protein
MVRRVPHLVLLIPLVHRKVGDPEELEVGGGAGLLEELVLVRNFCASSKRRAPTRL